jgi:pimeloyl-ACP methyl ester carboxylesterase
VKAPEKDSTGLIIKKGSPDKPAFIFIHGLGMNSLTWTAPAEARMMGGMLSLRTLLKEFKNTHTLFSDLYSDGCTVVTWSQRRPVGPAAEAEEELLFVLNEVSKIQCSCVVLIGHSRGGLIASRVISQLGDDGVQTNKIRGLITICTPHSGSSLSKWAQHLSPIAQRFKDALPETKRSVFLRSLDRSLGFIASKGAGELLPDSEFILSLPDALPSKVAAYSVGGNNPSLIGGNWLVFPEQLARMLPEGSAPKELMQGFGDALVTAESSVLAYAKAHRDFSLNHLTVLVSPDVREYLTDIIRREFY